MSRNKGVRPALGGPVVLQGVLEEFEEDPKGLPALCSIPGLSRWVPEPQNRQREVKGILNL